MKNDFRQLGFGPADILLPKDCDMTKWSVVACDQYTSEPEYWERVEKFVGEAPSTLHLILPEYRLEQGNPEGDIREIHAAMEQSIKSGIWDTLRDSFVYVERTQKDGAVRRGLVGAVDLEQYEYLPEKEALIRATEGTVLSRIPPRLAVRRGAAVELSHVMLLADDPEDTVMGPLEAGKESFRELYRFDLMENGGSIRGYAVDAKGAAHAAAALGALKQGMSRGDEAVPMLFAVGDGNHSLASAKAWYEEQKKTAGEGADLPCRYALAELVNLHEPALVFEPIHRVVFGIRPEELLRELTDFCSTGEPGDGGAQTAEYIWEGGEGTVSFPRPTHHLTVGTLQKFLDDYTGKNGGRIDYIHGDEAAGQLGRRPGNIAFLLPVMEKSQLFETVNAEGALPRKTFSMGEPWDKRYYLEGRKIR